jgi:hypothetical protein
MIKALRPLFIALLLCTIWAVPTFARRAITVTEKMSGGFGAGTGSTSNTTSYTTSDTAAIASGAIGLLFVCNSDSDSVETIDASTVIMNATTFQNPSLTQTYTGTPTQRISAFWIAGAQSAATISAGITGAADNQTGMSFFFVELAGVDTASPIIQSKAGSSSAVTAHTVTLDGARTDDSILVFAICASTPETWTAEYSGVGTEGVYATPDLEGRLQWDIDGADTTPNWTSGTTSTAGFIAIEIRVAGAAAARPPGALFRLGIGDRR